MKHYNRIGTILAGLLIGGIAYWFQPYNQMTVLGIHIYLIMGVGSFIGSVLLMFFQQDKPLIIALMVSAGVASAVLARIVYDTTFWDSTSHNLAPFEIMLCLIVTVPATLAGVYLVLLSKKMHTSNRS